MYDNGQSVPVYGQGGGEDGAAGVRDLRRHVTSCQLPHPDWMLSAGKFSVDEEKATAQNSVFRLMNIPLLYLPYVTHPVEREERQSGFLIPVIGNSSTKGLMLGEQIYWAINRSTDLTVGAEYFSLRGWEQSATFRYRGLGNDFATAHYSGLQDRGTMTNGAYVNQGGEDVMFSGRHDFDDADAGCGGHGVSEFVRVSRGVYGELQPGGVERYSFDWVWGA